ncbi:hypothetical protein MRX96_044750 [Rhipicephalus microplus]
MWRHANPWSPSSRSGANEDDGFHRMEDRANNVAIWSSSSPWAGPERKALIGNGVVCDAVVKNAVAAAAAFCRCNPPLPSSHYAEHRSDPWRDTRARAGRTDSVAFGPGRLSTALTAVRDCVQISVSRRRRLGALLFRGCGPDGRAAHASGSRSPAWVWRAWTILSWSTRGACPDDASWTAADHPPSRGCTRCTGFNPSIHRPEAKWSFPHTGPREASFFAQTRSEADANAGLPGGLHCGRRARRASAIACALLVEIGPCSLVKRRARAFAVPAKREKGVSLSGVGALPRCSLCATSEREDRGQMTDSVPDSEEGITAPPIASLCATRKEKKAWLF